MSCPEGKTFVRTKSNGKDCENIDEVAAILVENPIEYKGQNINTPDKLGFILYDEEGALLDSSDKDEQGYERVVFDGHKSHPLQLYVKNVCIKKEESPKFSFRVKKNNNYIMNATLMNRLLKKDPVHLGAKYAKNINYLNKLMETPPPLDHSDVDELGHARVAFDNYKSHPLQVYYKALCPHCETQPLDHMTYTPFEQYASAP